MSVQVKKKKKLKNMQRKIHNKIKNYSTTKNEKYIYLGMF